MNILEAVAENLKTRNPTWRYPEESVEWTLSEIDMQAKAYAMRLEALAVKKGDRVGLLLDNCAEYAPLLLGAWRLNAIAVPLRPKPGKYFDLAEYLCTVHDICKFQTIIVAADADPITVDRCSQAFGISFIFLSEIFVNMNIPMAGNEVTCNVVGTSILPGDTAIIQFSSGTTGSPKGAVVTHAMMIAQLEQINRGVASGCNGSIVTSSASWLPFNHDMGLFIGLLNPLFAGSDNLLASPRYYMFKPHRWFQMMHKYETTLHFTTNTALSGSFKSLSKLDPGSLNLSQLYVYIGAEKVMPAVVRSAYRILGAFGMGKRNLRIGYGMAENTLGAASTNKKEISIRNFIISEDGSIQLASTASSATTEVVAIGEPHTGTRITIRDDKENELPELRLGQINIESPCVMGGYYQNIAATQNSLVGRRLKTGDMGFFYDKEFYYHSRKDDLLVIGGKNIVPDEIEAQVETIPFVRPTCAVLVGVNEPSKNEMQLRLLVEVKLPLKTMFGLEHRKQIQQKVFESSGLLIQSIQACEIGSVEKTSSGKKRRKIIAQRLARDEINMVN